MGSLKTLALAGVMLAGATGVAAAADLRGPAPVGLPPPPVAVPIAESSGWYLRGDIGVGQLGGKTEINQVGVGISRGFKEDFGSFFSGGIGVGYQFNNWLRADITGEYRSKASFEFLDRFCFAGPGGVCNVTPPYTNGQNRITGKISSMLFLANAYLDLGTWHGLTPYVGAGVGFANHRMTGVTDSGVTIVTQVPPAAPLIFPTAGYLGNGTKSNFAWAVMAGVGYEVNERLKLDLGYRYVNMGSVTSGASTCFGDPTCNFTVRAKNLDSHEFRFGMRWMLGGPVAAAPVAYPPVVAKKF